MFVQEEKIFAGKVLRLHVCASDGVEWLEEATEDTSVEQLKERCLKHVSRADRGPRPLRRPPARPPSLRRGGDGASRPFSQPPSRRPSASFPERPWAERLTFNPLV